MTASKPTDLCRDRSAFFDEKPLFQDNDHGYFCFRIPALVVSNEGTILAFCEGRKNSRADTGDIDLVLKRSLDGDVTWKDLRVVAEGGGDTMGNPCPVVDRSDGAIWLPLCRNNERVLILKSDDDGETWSDPVDITEDVLPPDWAYIGAGPGHGIQLESGRLVVPSWLGDSARTHGEVQVSYVIYSDDHGVAWKRGEILDRDAGDECEVVQLADETLYMNMRSRHGRKRRAYSHSKDGGLTWTQVKHDPQLPEPSCQGSIVRFTDAGRFDKNRILLAAPANPDARSHLTVRVSYDECQTWAVSKVLHEGSAAYSDLAVTSDSNILCLYEADDYTRILLARFNIEWLTHSKDHLRCKLL